MLTVARAAARLSLYRQGGHVMNGKIQSRPVRSFPNRAAHNERKERFIKQVTEIIHMEGFDLEFGISDKLIAEQMYQYLFAFARTYDAVHRWIFRVTEHITAKVPHDRRRVT